MKKIMLICSLLFLTVSCTTDSVENTNQDVIGYKYTTESIPTDPALPTSFRETIGNLQNGKFFTETTTLLLNGVQYGAPVTTQRYFYSNNRLDHYDRSDMMIYYYYDSNDNLVGCSGIMPPTPSSPGGAMHERYTHLPNNVVYCERVSLPYNDPNAIAGDRYILHRDNEGNVISAGWDHDMDGVATNVHAYTYSNGNMMTMQKPDGTVVTLSYSNAIDTYGELERLSRGKQVMQFPCAYVFTLGNVSNLLRLKISKNIASDEFLLSAYEVLPSGFYNKKTDVNVSPDYNETQVLEFFFN